ncbi:MAG TPA: hypothetical protein VK550_30935 [Polyangiaceae bacterium]|nr:hypothetical protein [Polyangiaceae bacterium]
MAIHVTPAEDWESYLRTRFPGYLLPESVATALSTTEARKFLESLSGRPDQLEILRAVALFAPRIEKLQRAVQGTFPELAKSLPARSATEMRLWEGGFQGRLDVQATQALHLVGRRTAFVTQSRRRVFDLPENLLLRAVCERLHRELMALRTAKALPDTGWAAAIRDCEGELRHLLEGTALRRVPVVATDFFHENAARQARSAGYHDAAEWASLLRDALDDDDPLRNAKIVAEGALLPLESSTRFEIAVALRLSEALEAALANDVHGSWVIERALILSGRKDMVSLAGRDGMTVRLFYNQSVLGPGAADRGGTHYLGGGRLRPDITLTIEQAGRILDATVIECKHSSDPSYLLGGYHEAVLYRWEYTDNLTGWPKAILVSSGPPMGGRVRTEDDVVAVDWNAWPPEPVIDSICARVQHAALAAGVSGAVGPGGGRSENPAIRDLG